MQLLIDDCTKIGNELFFVARNTNLFCKINILSKKIEIIDIIPNAPLNAERLCSKIVAIDNQLYLIPFFSDTLWCYDLIEEKWEGFKIDNIDNKSGVAYQAFVYENKIYMIGCFYPAIIVFDSIKKKFRNIDKPYEKIKNKSDKISDCYFRIDSCRIGEKVYLASCVTNLILEFNMENETYDLKEIGDKTDRFSGIDWDGENFWIASRFGSVVVKWDAAADKIERIVISEGENDKMNYSGVCCYDKTVILPARFGNITSYLNSETCKIENKQEKFSFVKVFDDGSLLKCYWDGLITYNSKKDEKFNLNTSVNREVYLDVVDRWKEYNDSRIAVIFSENEPFDLDMFLKII